MITSKAIFSSDGYVELVSYQNIFQGSIDLEENNFWPLRDEGTTVYFLQKLAMTGLYPELELVNWEYSQASKNLYQVLRTLSLLYSGTCRTETQGLVWEKHIAYMIATMQTETGVSYAKYDWRSVEGGEKTPDQLPTIKAKLDKDKYGNKAGTLDWYNFRGRGLVQVSWRGVYEKCENGIINYQWPQKAKDLYDWTDFHLVNPEGRFEFSEDLRYAKKAHDLVIATLAMSEGMINGWITGAKLTKWLNGSTTTDDDWKNSRKTVNALNKAKFIATAAKAAYEEIKTVSGLH